VLIVAAGLFALSSPAAREDKRPADAAPPA
jgi:hypothetical protein